MVSLANCREQKALIVNLFRIRHSDAKCDQAYSTAQHISVRTIRHYTVQGMMSTRQYAGGVVLTMRHYTVRGTVSMRHYADQGMMTMRQYAKLLKMAEFSHTKPIRMIIRNYANREVMIIRDYANDRTKGTCCCE